MCHIYEYRQVQCGQCNEYHGEKTDKDFKEQCRTAYRLGGFGTCKKSVQKQTVKRYKWKDCNNCQHRQDVHNMWF
ncbi:hypothetical protein PG990_000009 [Apiospora arundinis]|uniref:Uncharacterized protein n=1 Tax=Apiospora arundinis TaxID=335852 RepID=A0ABR2HY46_9PEZI